MALGDWSNMGILNNYSGGVRYNTSFMLDEDQARAKVTIDLGSVTATAEVHLNGQKVGVRVAPPLATGCHRVPEGWQEHPGDPGVQHIGESLPNDSVTLPRHPVVGFNGAGTLRHRPRFGCIG